MEEWKKIEWYIDYEISIFGRVRSLKFWKIKILKPWKYREYSKVWLWIRNKQKSFSVHRLVAQAFIPNPDNLPFVCHKKEKLDDSWRLYNWADNLWWGTNFDNVLDMYTKWRRKKI